MKNIAFLLFVCCGFFNNSLFAQRLETESILELNFEPFKIYRIDEERALVVTLDGNYCRSHRLDFLHFDKIVNTISLPESFVGQVKLEGDEIHVLTTIQLSDVAGIYGVRKHRFDLQGNLLMMPEEFYFDNFSVEQGFTQVFIVEAVEGFVLQNSMGNLYDSQYFENIYLRLDGQIEGDNGFPKIIKLDLFEGLGPGNLVVRQVLYAIDSRLMTYNYNIGTTDLKTIDLSDIRFATVSDDNEIVVVHGQTVTLYDFELNQMAQADLPMAMDYFYEEEGHLHALKPSIQPDSVMIYQDYQYLSFDLNSLVVTDEQLIKGVGSRVTDFYAENGKLHILSSSGTGKQIVLQKFDLILSPENHGYTDLSTGDFTVKDKRVFWNLIPAVEATLEVPVQNLSEEFISVVSYGTYYKYFHGFGCGEEVLGNVDVQLGFQDEEAIGIKVICSNFRTVDGGDSLLFTCPCVDIFPYEHHIDLNESNNQVCAEVKVSSSIVATEEQLLDQNWTLFPNPVKNELFIQSSDLSIKSADWQIMDLRGQTVHAGEFQLTGDLQNISFNVLNQGMYIFQLTDPVSGSIFGVQKLVKE